MISSDYVRLRETELRETPTNDVEVVDDVDDDDLGFSDLLRNCVLLCLSVGYVGQTETPNLTRTEGHTSSGRDE